MSKLRIGSLIAGCATFLMFFNMNFIPLYIFIPFMVIMVIQLLISLLLKGLKNDSAFKIITNIYSLIMSYILLGSFLVLTIFYLANFPPTKPFEEKLTLYQLNNEDKTNYQEFTKLLKEYNDVISKDNKDYTDSLRKYDYKNTVIRNLIDNSDDIREKVFNYVLNNNIAIPITEINKKYNNDDESISDDSNSPTSGFTVLFSLEMTEIKKNLDEKKYDEVSKKYERMWLFTKKMLQWKNSSLVDSLISMYFVSGLSEFYLDNQKELVKIDFGSTKNIVSEVPSLIEDSYFYAFAGEYQCQKAVCEKCKYRWPAFDKYDTIKKLHEVYSYDIDSIRGNGDKNKINEVERLTSTPFWFVKNPCGNILFDMCASLFGGISDNVLQKEYKVQILNYALNMDKYKANPPVDKLTGKPIELIDMVTYIKIPKSSAIYRTKDENSYYEIYK